MRIARLLSACFLVPVLTLAAAPASAARPTLAVLPFTVDREVVVVTPRAILEGTVESQTSLLTDELIHQLVATRKFDVLERQRVDDLIREKQFRESDYASPEEAPKLARLLGADYFVLGRLDDIGAETVSKTVPYSSTVVTQQEGHLKVYLRIIDARSGRIVAADKVLQEAVLRLPLPDRRFGKPSPRETLGGKLLAEAAGTLVGRITDSVFPLRVAQVSGKTLYLNRGADSSGLKPGDVLAVIRQGDAIVDTDTGETLGHTETEVARVTVTDVQARFVKADITTGDEPVATGMLVRKATVAAVPPPAVDTPTGPRW